ncbi:hypothetical protein [Stutzerimonas stutzeri]|uniref:hypothetical protein n=1 Tax=Stutzerimonas stutzeri TaxID=316 RepID=UPI00210DB730|nr:hypothetical protein [Stutzerimonas stutzeri]MCQ4322059.1 hypothetical protein [Stutzerimonas stutzeri]
MESVYRPGLLQPGLWGRLAARLIQLRDGAPGFAEAQRRMDSLVHQCADGDMVSVDPGIAYVANYIGEDPGARLRYLSVQGA